MKLRNTLGALAISAASILEIGCATTRPQTVPDDPWRLSPETQAQVQTTRGLIRQLYNEMFATLLRNRNCGGFLYPEAMGISCDTPDNTFEAENFNDGSIGLGLITAGGEIKCKLGEVLEDVRQIRISSSGGILRRESDPILEIDGIPVQNPAEPIPAQEAQELCENLLKKVQDWLKNLLPPQEQAQ